MNSSQSISERHIEAILSGQFAPDPKVLRDIAQDTSISLQQRYLAACCYRFLSDSISRSPSPNPLLDIPSTLINNPLWDEVTENIAAYRIELDEDLEIVLSQSNQTITPINKESLPKSGAEFSVKEYLESKGIPLQDSILRQVRRRAGEEYKKFRGRKPSERAVYKIKGNTRRRSSSEFVYTKEDLPILEKVVSELLPSVQIPDVQVKPEGDRS